MAIHLSSKCNLNCTHCYVAEFNQQGLSLEDIDNIVASSIKLNVVNWSLTGGEPFLFTEFIRKFMDAGEINGIRVENIFSNGLLIAERTSLVRELVSKFNTIFYISVDGVGNSYDEFRRVKDGFKKLEDGLSTLADNKAILVANIFIHQGNYDHLVDIYQYLKRYPNLYRVRLDSGFHLGNWVENEASHGVSLEKEVAGVAKLLDVWSKEGMPYELEYGHLFRYLYGKKVDLGRAGYTPDSLCCAYYKNYLFIFPNGDVTPCGLTWPYYVCGNIRKEPLEVIWENEKMRKFKELRIKNLGLTECNGCPHLGMCGAGCRGNAMLAGKGLSGIDQEICLLFKSGVYKQFI